MNKNKNFIPYNFHNCLFFSLQAILSFLKNANILTKDKKEGLKKEDFERKDNKDVIALWKCGEKANAF